VPLEVEFHDWLAPLTDHRIPVVPAGAVTEKLSCETPDEVIIGPPADPVTPPEPAAGEASWMLLVVKPTTWPAAERVAVSVRVWVLWAAIQDTLTVIRLKSMGCASAVPVVELSLQKLESCTPYPSLGSSTEHSVALSVYVMPSRSTCHEEPDTLPRPGIACSCETTVAGDSWA